MMPPPSCSSSARRGSNPAASTARAMSSRYTASNSTISPAPSGFFPRASGQNTADGSRQTSALMNPAMVRAQDPVRDPDPFDLVVVGGHLKAARLVQEFSSTGLPQTLSRRRTLPNYL